MGNVNPSRIDADGVRRNEPLRMEGRSGSSGDGKSVTFGSNAVKKFRSHAERIRTNAKAHGFDIPRGGIKKPEVQAKIDVLDDEKYFDIETRLDFQDQKLTLIKMQKQKLVVIFENQKGFELIEKEDESQINFLG